MKTLAEECCWNIVHLTYELGSHIGLFRIIHALRGQRRRSSCCGLELVTARGDHYDYLGVPGVLYHGCWYWQGFCCYPDGPPHVTKQMAKMGSLFPVHLRPHRQLLRHYLRIRPMLASKDALDPFRRPLLGSQEKHQSRSCACKCVQDLLLRLLLLQLLILNKRLERLRGFCPCYLWSDYDLELTDK